MGWSMGALLSGGTSSTAEQTPATYAGDAQQFSNAETV